MKRKLFLILICVISASMLITGCKNSTDDSVPENTDIREEEPTVEKTVVENDFIKIYKLNNNKLKVIKDNDELIADYVEERGIFGQSDKILNYRDEYNNNYRITKDAGTLQEFNFNDMYLYDYKQKELKEISEEKANDIFLEFLNDCDIDTSGYDKSFKWDIDYKYSYNKSVSGINCHSYMDVIVDRFGSLKSMNIINWGYFNKFEDKEIDADAYYNLARTKIEEKGYEIKTISGSLVPSEDKQKMTLIVTAHVYTSPSAKEYDMLETESYDYLIE